MKSTATVTNRRRELLEAKRDDILRIAARHGARNVRIFGSVARGDDDESSDIDLMVDMDPDRSLLDHAALLLELRALLGDALDVVSSRGMKPRIRDRALREAVAL
jgi:predicted nucleotidyltransferase